VKPPKGLLDLLKRYDRNVQEVALALRDIVIEELAPCHERIFEVYIISLAYASTEKVMKTGICYIGVQQKWVNLGFWKGTSLRNDHGLLEGTGKGMRHIKVRNMSDVMHPGLRDYIREAAERAGHDLDSGKKKTVTTVIKRKKDQDS
jgi:hypothetical protein